jgi:hypothetical protein
MRRVQDFVDARHCINHMPTVSCRISRQAIEEFDAARELRTTPHAQDIIYRASCCRISRQSFEEIDEAREFRTTPYVEDFDIRTILSSIMPNPELSISRHAVEEFDALTFVAFCLQLRKSVNRSHNFDTALSEPSS